MCLEVIGVDENPLPQALLGTFVSKRMVYYFVLVMLYDKFEMIQTFLLGLCFEHCVNKGVRSDVHMTGKMLQEEAVITAVQRMADVSFIAFLR